MHVLLFSSWVNDKINSVQNKYRDSIFSIDKPGPRTGCIAIAMNGKSILYLALRICSDSFLLNDTALCTFV